MRATLSKDGEVVRLLYDVFILSMLRLFSGFVNHLRRPSLCTKDDTARAEKVLHCCVGAFQPTCLALWRPDNETYNQKCLSCRREACNTKA
jgi:hypothetical protein